MRLEEIHAIKESHGVINVTYKNDPVWIYNVEEDNRLVKVKNLRTNKIEDVPLVELKTE
ncbi:MAG: small, acid-soluble spore protein, H family [Bacillota bacterium]|nr:small, acid-soluble spore protein, H family [Bacillota bacterium]